MLYRETVAQAQLLAYADDFWVLALLFAAMPLFLPFMRRVRAEPATGQASTRERSAEEEAIRAGAVE